MSSKLKQSESVTKPDSASNSPTKKKKKGKDRGPEIEGQRIEGLSIAGQETCVIFPNLNIAFDIGRCPLRAVAQDFVFISHGHMDHIGGLPMYVATRGLFSMKPPTVVVPKVIKEHVEKLFEVHRAIDKSELKLNLIGLDVGEEFYIRKDLKVRAFKTYHVIPSQGYLVYSVKQKLKLEFAGLCGKAIKELKISGVEITNTITSPEIAFTGDTMADFVVDPANSDVLRARILVMECTFLDDTITVDHAREYGHMHMAEVVKYCDWFENKAILLIHFSARYQVEEINDAVSKMAAPFTGRVFALTEGI
ncbi:tRNA 3' processing endoribonuclease [Dionaea muscipula]